MAKLSGLIGAGKIGTPDKSIVDAMPEAPAVSTAQNSLSDQQEVRMLESSIVLDSSVMQTVELPISSIRPSPYQVRALADDEYIENLMNSIVSSGVISPIIVRKIPAGEYEVIAGHHRIEASRKLGRTTITAVVKKMSDGEAACALTSDNFIRKELSDYEKYKHAKLLKEKGFCRSMRELGSVLGVSRQLIGFLLAFDEYPAGAKDILEKNPTIIGATTANEVKDLAKSHPELFTEALEQLANGKIKQNQIRKWVEDHFKQSNLRTASRHDVKITRPELGVTVKLAFTAKEAKIQCEGLDIEALKALLEANLDKLIKKVAT